jgi:hypothetical protein
MDPLDRLLSYLWRREEEQDQGVSGNKEQARHIFLATVSKCLPP